MSRRPTGKRPAAAPTGAKLVPDKPSLAALRALGFPYPTEPFEQGWLKPGDIAAGGEVVYSIPDRWFRERIVLDAKARTRIVDATHLTLTLPDTDATRWWGMVEFDCDIYRLSHQRLPISFNDGARLDKALAEVIAALKPFVDNDPGFSGHEVQVMVAALDLQTMREDWRDEGHADQKRATHRPTDSWMLNFVSVMKSRFRHAFGRTAATTDNGPFARFLRSLAEEARLPKLPTSPSSIRKLMKRAEGQRELEEQHRKELPARITSSPRKEVR